MRGAGLWVYALGHNGLAEESWGSRWVLPIEQAGTTKVLYYDLDGCQPPPEREDPALESYRWSVSARRGNAAADQLRSEAYGEILDCAYRWGGGGGPIELALRVRLHPLTLVRRAGGRP